MRIKILLDMDIGSDIDDVVCLAYLLAQPQCDLLGITTVSGEVEKRAQIARIAAIYSRMSTTDQADKGYSLPTQVEAGITLAQREGYTVPPAYVFTEDYPGTSLNRSQFSQVRELVRSQAVHALIVYDLDRLSRKLAHQMLLSDELEQAHVTLHEVIMPTGVKTPETQLMTNVRSVIAEYEREKILERTARGRIGRVKAGFVPEGGLLDIRSFAMPRKARIMTR